MWDASDEALLAGFATGDGDATISFVRRFQRRVYGLALAITGERTDAEEVAQDAFVRAWRYAASFDPRRGSVEGWLLGIARNQGIERIRLTGRRRAEESTADLAESLLISGLDTAETVADRREVDRVVAAMRELPQDQRRALVSAALRGYSAREISEAEHVPLGTVKTRIRLGLQKLRAELGVRVE